MRRGEKLEARMQKSEVQNRAGLLQSVVRRPFDFAQGDAVRCLESEIGRRRNCL